jgi:hypothetical protein
MWPPTILSAQQLVLLYKTILEISYSCPKSISTNSFGEVPAVWVNWPSAPEYLTSFTKLAPGNWGNIFNPVTGFPTEAEGPNALTTFPAEIKLL